MNIKEKIGERIQKERISQGLSRVELAALTDDLKPSRISNWERGDRTPGPQEIKQLARALKVSPAYLMCLSDEKEGNNRSELGVLIPFLEHEQAANPIQFIAEIQELENQVEAKKINLFPVSKDMDLVLGKYAFALRMKDDSMDPEIRKNDIVIVDPEKKPQPGSLVVAKLENDEEVIIRQYKLLSVSKNMQDFELLSMNKHWPDIQNNPETNCRIIGLVCGINRKLSF